MAKKNNEKKNNEKKVSEIVEKVKSSESFLKGYLNNWTRFYKLYRCFIDDDKWPTKTKIFNPYIYSAIETHTSKSVASKPDGEFQPTNKETTGDPEKVGLAFDYWWRTDRATFKGQAMFKKSLMYGSAMARVFWKFKTGYVSGKKKVIDDRPSILLNRLEDGMCGFDPESDSWENVRYAWDKCYVTKTELNDWMTGPEKESFDAKELKLAIENFDNNSETDTNAYKTEKIQIADGSKITDNTIKKAECIYLEDYESGEVTTLIARKYLIRQTPNHNPFERSFIFTIDTIVPSEVLGMGEIEPVERLQHGLNLVQNQRRDNVASVLKHQWIVGDDANIDDDELVDELNGIIHAKDVNKIKPLFKPNVTGEAYQEELSIKNDIQSALAITDASKGSTANLDTQKSGRALQLLQGAADARVQGKLQLFEIMFIKEVAEKWQRLASKYQKESLVIFESGKIREIPATEFQGEHSYYVESGSTTHTDRTQEKEEYMAYQKEIIVLADLKQKSMVMANPVPQIDPKTGQPAIDPTTGQPMIPQPAQPILNFDKMAEKLSEKFNIKDWRELWVAGEEVQPQGETLPEIGDIPQREKTFGQGEMLPSIDEEGAMPAMGETPNQPKGEMLPSIDE